MSAFAEFMALCRAEHARLCKVLDQWVQAASVTRARAMSLTPAPDAPFGLANGLLNLQNSLPDLRTPYVAPAGLSDASPRGEPADAELPTEAPSDASQAPASGGDSADGAAPQEAPPVDCPAEASRKELLKRVSLLGVEIAGIHAGLLDRLADIVIDSHIARMLLLGSDRFHVSTLSVLGAIALANLSCACAGQSVSQAEIILPLQVAVGHSDLFRNGDLLFWDVMARSAFAAQTAKGLSRSAASILNHCCPVFLAHSILAKLDFCFNLPIKFVKAADYRKWPGLAALVADGGSRSLRRHVVGRLAIKSSGNPELGTAVVGAWLQAMASLEASLQPAAMVMEAEFLWEMLAHSEEAFCAMLKSKVFAVPVQRVVTQIEEYRASRPPEEPAAAAVYRHLRDVAACVDTYPPYAQLVAMSRQKPAAKTFAALANKET